MAIWILAERCPACDANLIRHRWDEQAALGRPKVYTGPVMCPNGCELPHGAVIE